MQILKKTGLKAFEKAKKLGGGKVVALLEKKGLTGRGGAGFPTAKKWQFALNTKADERFVICNADEGEPGTFKDKFILENNPETLVEGILIAAHTLNAKRAFIYLRGEYEYLKDRLEKVVKDIIKKAKSDVSIEIVVGAGSYVCGEETAIIQSISGYRPHPYIKPPFPAVEGLWRKPTVLNNVETLTNVAQAILFDDWDNTLRLMSLSGNVPKPGLYELPVDSNLCKLLELGGIKSEPKAIYFGCFGGCMRYCDIKLTPENVGGRNCIIGAYTIIAVDKKQSIVDVAIAIAKFYCHESCGKCTPCREGTVRILHLLEKINSGKATREDLDTLQDLAENIHETSLCGLGQTATNHVLTALEYFKDEFEAKIK